jgi:uncharacterized protein YcbK (DUF882 family)
LDCLHCLASRVSALDRRGSRLAKNFIQGGPAPASPSARPGMSRRELLGLVGAAACAAALAPRDASAQAQAQASATQMRVQPVVPAGARRVWLYNATTGESFNDVYWLNGRYVGASLRQLNVLLRDHHTGAVIQVDPRLFDILAQLHRTLRLREPLQVVSGYRTPETNAQLLMHSSGVAENSLHMRGMAIDIMTDSRSAGEMTRAARAMQVGGVGNYLGARFIHVDSGPLRTWTY